jgi:DNA-binding beta-propeller fold protein YncE
VLACAGAACSQEASVFGAQPATGHGVFRFPQAIAFTPGGSYVFVADQYSSVVQKFDRQGNWQLELGWPADRGQLGRLGVIGGLATDRANHLYVLDSENGRVQVFRSDTGDWLGAFGSLGTGFGFLNPGDNTGAGGIALFQQTPDEAPIVYIADQYNHRVQKLTLDQLTTDDPSHPLLSRQRVLPRGGRSADNPNYVPVPTIDAAWGQFGDCHTSGCTNPAYDYRLNYPQGIAVTPKSDPNGRHRVYVADDDNHRVVEYDSQGSYLNQVGSYGTGAGQFRFPYDVGVDGRTPAYLYVADNNNHRVQKFDAASLAFVSMWGGFGAGPGQAEYPRALSALSDDPQGGVYLADSANNRVQGFDADGNLTASWGIAGRGAGYFTRPSGVAVDEAGNVYVADTVDHRIEKLSPGGSYLAQWGYVSTRSGYAAPASGDGQFNLPSGVAFDPRAGHLWVADTGNNRVQELSQAGAWIATHTGFAAPQAIAVDANGNVYVADTGNDRVRRRDSASGGWSTVATGGQSLAAPGGLAVDGSGTLYVSDSGNNRVLRISGGTASPLSPPAGSLSRPSGIAAFGGGVFVADSGNSRVLRLDTATGSWDTIGSEGAATGSLVGPAGLATTAAGDALYVADTLNNRIQRFSGLQWAGYARPKGATPVLVSLVPAYRSCQSANRVHRPPLAGDSCAPPTQESADLTVGTPDANGAAARSTGSVRLDAVVGNPSTTGDEADLRLRLSVTDVRRAIDLSDYSGELGVRIPLRITDEDSGTSGAATVSDLSLGFVAPCAATQDATVGGTCLLSTTVDSVAPGTLEEGKRSIWQLGSVELLDGGSDGNASTAGNTVFARQGLFVP